MRVEGLSQNQALIVGAGAIGRGFLAPRLVEEGISVSFADVDPDLISILSKRNPQTYQTAIARADGYDMLEVSYNSCRDIAALGKSADEFDYLFFCVGVKQIKSAAERIFEQLSEGSKLQGIYTLENEPKTVGVLEQVFMQKFPVYFCVPDVITSSKAPAELLHIDPVCVASEVGDIYLEGPNLFLAGPHYEDGYVQQHWIAKKYLHNTPHAALAYLGAEKGYDYIHQAAHDTDINRLVLTLVRQIRNALKPEYGLADNFLNGYIQKELKRFRNKNLYDPIVRVARNPDVKLHPEERILYVRSLLEKYGEPLDEISTVIRAALCYRASDEFNHMRENLGVAQLLEKLTGLVPESDAGRSILAPLLAREV